MKVLIVKEALPSGGAERQLALLVQYLPDEVEREVWAMGGGPFVDVVAAAGHPVHIDARRHRLDVRPALGLWRLLLRLRPDVVHSWDWMSTLAAAPLCALLGIPIVDSTIRNGIARRRRAFPLTLARMFSRLVVANSEAGLLAWGIDPAKGRVIYNAFDTARWSLCETGGGDEERAAGSPGADAAAGSQPNARRLVTVVMTGRMVRHKDFASLLAVAAQLDRERPGDWRFELLGDGPDKAALLTQAGELVAREVVVFDEPGIEVLPRVREADIGVLLSDERLHREGCSNAIIEYMACGLPVIATSGGGNPELVVDGVTGALVPCGDRAALAEQLRRLAADPAAARRMGAAGRERIRELYTVQRLVRGWMRVYAEASS